MQLGSEGQVLEDGPVSQRSSSGLPGDCAVNSHTDSNFHYKLSLGLKTQKLMFIGAQLMLKQGSGVKHMPKFNFVSSEYFFLEEYTFHYQLSCVNSIILI